MMPPRVVMPHIMEFRRTKDEIRIIQQLFKEQTYEKHCHQRIIRQRKVIKPPVVHPSAFIQQSDNEDDDDDEDIIDDDYFFD